MTRSGHSGWNVPRGGSIASHGFSRELLGLRSLNISAAVLAYPAVVGFAWLWLIDGRQRGLLGFALIWLLVAGVYIRVYAQFLRWWHQVDYSAVSRPAPRPG